SANSFSSPFTMGVICAQRGQLSVKKKRNVGLSAARGSASLSVGVDGLPLQAVSRSSSVPSTLMTGVVFMFHPYRMTELQGGFVHAPASPVIRLRFPQWR